MVVEKGWQARGACVDYWILWPSPCLLAAPGSPPTSVKARPVSASTVVVQWKEPEIPNGVVRVS